MDTRTDVSRAPDPSADATPGPRAVAAFDVSNAVRLLAILPFSVVGGTAIIGGISGMVWAIGKPPRFGDQGRVLRCDSLFICLGLVVEYVVVRLVRHRVGK